MNNQVRLFRGSAAPTREYALKVGLSMLNESSLFIGDIPSGKGGFFYKESPTIQISSAEEFARDVAEKERKTPCVIDLILKPMTYRILQGRIHTVKFGANGFDYLPVDSFESLDRSDGYVTVNLMRLRLEELNGLGVKVGFIEGDDFIYKAYGDWMDELAVQRETRSEINDLRFGRGFGWMK